MIVSSTIQNVPLLFEGIFRNEAPLVVQKPPRFAIIILGGFNYKNNFELFFDVFYIVS